MANKQYEMLFKLNAQANSGFKGTFSQAQAEFARLGNEIQNLNRVQSDISAYQKQTAAIDSTKAKIANLTKQHELLSQQIKNTTGDTTGLQIEQLKLDRSISSAQGALERQQGRLTASAKRFDEAGVSTAGLAGESAKLTAQIEELSKEQEQAAQTAQNYKNRAVDAFHAAGEALAAGGIVAGIQEIGAAYVGTVQAAGEFGAAMSNVEALSGANRQEMAALTAQAKELGATTKFTANESGEAMGYMGMAGWNAQQMLAGMPGALDLAAASGEDLAGVADIVTDSLTGFGLTAADTGQFVDVLAAASTKSNTNVSLLGESFKYVAPLCGTLGYSAEDAAVSLGLMANAGIKGSQAGLFEQMAVEVETSVGDMISSLESQAAYMSSYSENLRAAAEMGLSDGLIAQLSDGSTESAAYLQEIVTNGQGKIDELNAAFAKVQEGKENFSTTVAEMQTNLQSTMDEAARTVDSTVQEMNMYQEAAQSARSTMQGFIDGANGMSESVQAAYRSVALGAMAALQGAMGAGLSVSRGYATGTTDAEPGFAMVGENGPELVFFQGGEQVVNAAQTAAMQRQPALTAAPAGPSGGEPMVIQIYFQFEGSATPEAVAQLREYGAEFEARVRQVMEDYALDSARRRY